MKGSLGWLSMRWFSSVTILLLAFGVSAGAQTPAVSTANRNASSKPPDLVCWGSVPDWSIQFAWWGARYLGIDEPDQDFRGHFFWDSKNNMWVWQRFRGFSPISGPHLSAVVRESSCTDHLSKENFPYSAQVGLPQGDSVTGCCRELKPGEAPIGPHGVPPHDTPQP